MQDITYDVRIYKTDVYKGKKVTTYYVRWKVGGKPWKEPFRRVTQADSFRSSLMTAARNGEAFSLTTGRPVSWKRTIDETSWYDFACAYVDMKWKDASAKYRHDIAYALTTASPAMYSSRRGKPADVELRKALRRWAFNTKQRATPPEDVARVLDWLSRSTKPVSALADATAARQLLDTATSRLDGTRFAPSTARRNRTILANALDYAVERKLLSANPIKAVKWTAPKTSHQVDRRSVVNPRQARRLLAAVRAQKPSGERLTVFFAVMYYAALRPEEAISLTRSDVTVPDLVWNEEQQNWEEPSDDWGELHFRAPTPDAGREWTDDGSQRDRRRQLKHRADHEERRVPSAPQLTKLLRAHLQTIDMAPAARLFNGVRGGELPTITYRRAWRSARRAALIEQEADGPLAKRPYDLRHACVSTWLNGGVPPTQVAEWAGHSVEVLLRIYAACLVGQNDLAKKRIIEALEDD